MATTVLLFVLAGMGLILLVMMVFFGNNSLLISQNFKDSENPENSSNSKNSSHSKNAGKISDSENPYSYHNHYTPDETDDPDGESVPHRGGDSDTQTETAKVIWKLDERERFLNENHFSTIRNEKYALIFQKADGTEFRVSCSKAAYSKTPYDVTGEVTFRNQKLIRFTSKQETVSDEYSI
ncbi:MAG: hypothetical protein K2O42_00305, partial [Oscillospiraceae bacterium]|nr:hypothetical protein [Oscillospiraceae bacterium]